MSVFVVDEVRVARRESPRALELGRTEVPEPPPASRPPCHRTPLPHPDDVIHIRWSAAFLFELGQALAAMMLDVQHGLGDGFGDGEQAGRFWKPGDAYDAIQRGFIRVG